MKQTNFLPDGYETLRTEKKYINLGKLPEGEIRIRIVQRPIAGWIDWKDNKPYRYRPSQKPKNSFDPTKPLRPFWALYVWDYSKQDLFVMEITQSTIKKALEEYALNSDWGDLKQYDIKIKKEGAGKDTNYTVIPVPHKPISQDIIEALNFAPVRLEALYEGKDPWKDLEPSEEELEPITKNPLNEGQCAQIDFILSSMGHQNKEKHANAIMKNLKIDSIYSANQSDFERVLSYLERALKLQEEIHESA